MKRVLFVSFWEEALKEIVEFLRVHDYQDTAMLKHLEELLNGKDK